MPYAARRWDLMPLLPLLRSEPDCGAASDPDSLPDSIYGLVPYSRSQTERRNWDSPTVRR